jgi:MFS family permease
VADDVLTTDDMLTRPVAAPPAAQGNTLAGGEPRLDRGHILVMVLLLGAQFMLSVDFSILNVALPAIGTGLGLGLSSVQWVATAFALPAAGLTLLFGRIGDLYGRRRLFLIGLALLAGASLLGGLAGSAGVLLAARAVQGIASAMTIPAALALLTTAFPEGPLRARALGLNGALLSGGFTIGALLGGLLTDLLSWRWAFLVNVPVALVLLAATPRLVRPSRAAVRARLDVPGAVTATLGLLALIFGISTAARAGWTDPVALASLAAAVLLLVGFWFIELRAPAPLASVRILSRSTVKWGNLGGFVVFTTGSAVVFLMTLYLQRVLGYSPLLTGVAFGVPGLSAVLAGAMGPRLIGRLGRRGALTGGLLVQAVFFAPLLLLGIGRWGILVLLAALLFAFFGHIVVVVAYTVTATSGLPDSEQGLATGLSTLTQQVAITVGIPVFSAVATAGTARYAARGATGALLAGIHLSLAVDVAVTLVGAAVVWTGLRRLRG